MSILDKILNKKVWYLENTDTGEKIQGQFPAEGLIENVSSKYAKHTALNRKDPIFQFLNGDADTISFTGVLFNTNGFIGHAENDLQILKNWVRLDDKLGRPPILSFWVGDNMVDMPSCVLESLTNVAYDQPTSLGAFRRATFALSLSKYEPYSLDVPLFGETRYHYAAKRDYYEMLALREYNSPMMGDIIRHRHPKHQSIQVGNIIKFPDKTIFRTETIEPKSIILKGVNSKRFTPQRQLLIDTLKNRDRNYVSHVI